MSDEYGFPRPRILHNAKAEWMEKAHCRKTKIKTDLFFPERGGATDAAQMCNPCTVKIECLNYALDNHITHGVWGGKSGRQRRPLQKERNEQSKTERN